MKLLPIMVDSKQTLPEKKHIQKFLFLNHACQNMFWEFFPTEKNKKMQAPQHNEPNIGMNFYWKTEGFLYLLFFQDTA